ncbi:MAG: M20/M25/M40 family metallo-hydrolase [Lachnospiraceae bacterium]
MDKWLEEQILKISNRNEQKVLNLRHQIHQDPELSFKEFHTSERVKKILEDMGLKVHSGIAGTGLVADIVGEKPCDNPKTLLLRADMDALPLQEENDLPFRSQNPGVMHACGHDVHTSNLVGVAWILNELKELVRQNPPGISTSGRKWWWWKKDDKRRNHG